MSLVTFEVDIDHGRVTPRGSEPLPDRATGVLTLLPGSTPGTRPGAVSEFIAKWAGAFALPESRGDDPRLDYLLDKHIK